MSLKQSTWDVISRYAIFLSGLAWGGVLFYEAGWWWQRTAFAVVAALATGFVAGAPKLNNATVNEAARKASTSNGGGEGRD